MKILFAALHYGYYRNLEPVVEELARRGHEIHLGCERPSVPGGQSIVERLAADYPRLSYGLAPSRETDALFLASKIRLGLDYLRYLEPQYNASSGLRPRAQVRTPTGVVRMMRTPLLSSAPARRLVAGGLDLVDRAVSPSPAIERFLDERRPDLVAITPLIGLVASSQLDLLRSAIARRIPTIVFVYSWDYLSSKAIIRDHPDGLFVWNGVQKSEAIQMHGVPDDRIVVTGAQCYDQWFGRSPSRPRAEFVRRAGLPDERPYILWACSALLPGSPREPEVVLRWLAHVRASGDPCVRDAAILIRPHPSRLADWEGVDWRRFGNITMFGDVPIASEARADYFDSIYHSAAVVGITTSAFIEAAVIGRPVMTFFDETLRQEHEGSLHFQHLLSAESGLLTNAATLDEHERQLAAMLTGPPPGVLERTRRFVQAFVRPHGLDVPATTIAADAVERIGARPATTSARRSSVVGRAGLRVMRAIEHSPRWRPLLLDERELEAHSRQREKDRRREQKLAHKASLHAEKQRRREERDRRLEIRAQKVKAK